jgi:tripartite-type tricarboxylate transporter receptor subunit TctC
MLRRLAVSLLFCLWACSGPLLAQTPPPAYPTRGITIIVTAAAGGVSDVVARALAGQLADAWGQQVIIENRGGAAHVAGAAAVAKAAPDGYTLLVAEAGTFTINPIIYPKGKLPYDETRDFAPITGLVQINQALTVSAKLGVSTVGEFIELAKKKPGEITYGTAGVGSAGHTNIILLESLTGIKLTPVHYRGAALALNDIIAGHINAMSISIGLVAGPARVGQVKILGVGSKQRVELASEFPTVAESGVPGFEAVTWFGLFGPAALPREVVTKLNAAAKKVFAEPAFQDKFLSPQMFTTITDTPEKFAAFIKADVEKWAPVIRGAGIKVE